MLFQIIIQSIDTLVERLPLSSHVPEEPQNTDRKVGRRLRKERINLPFENLAPLPKRISTPKQDRPELVQEGLSSIDQPRTEIGSATSRERGCKNGESSGGA